MEGYERWNKYELGNIHFVNKHKDHPCRKIYIDYVVNNCNSVVEIGPGELIEYQKIKYLKPDIDYTVVDVSELFLNNCKEKFPEVNRIQSTMEDVKLDKKYDIVYVSSVLEHSKDIVKTIRNLLTQVNSFCFVMFKWNYGGDLKSIYHNKGHHWSTSFNIWRLIDEIEKYADITYLSIAKKSGEIVDFKKYSLSRHGENRNSDYLVIIGKSRV